jgi:hypothetical protein
VFEVHPHAKCGSGDNELKVSVFNFLFEEASFLASDTGVVIGRRYTEVERQSGQFLGIFAGTREEYSRVV